jgi:hypothetical protein
MKHNTIDYIPMKTLDIKKFKRSGDKEFQLDDFGKMPSSWHSRRERHKLAEKRFRRFIYSFNIFIAVLFIAWAVITLFNN